MAGRVLAHSELGIYDSRLSPDCQPSSEAHTENGRGKREWLKSMYDIAIAIVLHAIVVCYAYTLLHI